MMEIKLAFKLINVLRRFLLRPILTCWQKPGIPRKSSIGSKHCARLWEETHVLCSPSQPCQSLKVVTTWSSSVSIQVQHKTVLEKVTKILKKHMMAHYNLFEQWNVSHYWLDTIFCFRISFHAISKKGSTSNISVNQKPFLTAQFMYNLKNACFHSESELINFFSRSPTNCKINVFPRCRSKQYCLAKFSLL